MAIDGWSDQMLAEYAYVYTTLYGSQFIFAESLTEKLISKENILGCQLYWTAHSAAAQPIFLGVFVFPLRIGRRGMA